MRAIIVLTAYNEARNIPSVLERIGRKYPVLVIDDGSTDTTSEIASGHGAEVIRHPLNLGQGEALLTGLKAAAGQGWEAMIEMDADGQHRPEEIPLFLDKLLESEADIIAGSRIIGSAAPTSVLRRTFLPYFSGLLRKVTGYDFSDPLCGFRAFRLNPRMVRVIEEYEGAREAQYIAAEMWVHFARAGLKVAEVPVTVEARTSGRSYKKEITYGLRVLSAVVKSKLDKGSPIG